VETLREYIRHFFKQCNELPDIVDADVIGAFISGTTNESLVHELGRNKPRTTWELLDLATSHASGEEAARANFSRSRGKAPAEPMDGAKDRGWRGKGRKNRKRRDGEFIAAVDRVDKQKTGRGNPISTVTVNSMATPSSTPSRTATS
jgi:hypothetical protein